MKINQTIPTLYDQDFQQWIEQTVQQLETGDYQSLDIKHLVEELIDLGKTEKNALESNLMILLAHLLKLFVQSDALLTLKNSWYHSIIEHRERVIKALDDTPSLKNYLPTIVESAYSRGRKIAITEGKIAFFGVRIPQEKEYPNSCPFSVEQILDEDFFSV